MGKIIHISVRDKVALYSARDGAIICGNDDYQVQFALDPEWDGVPAKARFIWNGQYEDAPIVDGIAKVPRIIRAHEVRVGVYSEDESLQTTTAARVPCGRSILCDTAEPTEGNEAFYASEAQEAADRAEAAADRAEAAGGSGGTGGGVVVDPESVNQAQEAAQRAEAAQEAAQESAQAAADFAQAAGQSAEEAETSKNQATAAKEAAQEAATNAGKSATAAAGSATTASNAVTAAQTAQGKAEAAQTVAENARDTASEKAADSATSAQEAEDAATEATNAAQTATNAAQRAEAAAGGTIADGSITPEKTTFIMKVGEGEPYIERTPDFTPIEKSEGFAWEAGKTLSGSVGSGVTVGDKTNSVLSPYIPVALGKMIRVKGMSHTTANRGSFKIAMFSAEKVAAGMSPVLPAAPKTAGTGCLEAQDPTEFADGIARYKVGYTVSTSTAGYESGVVGSSDFVTGTQAAIAYIRICGIPAGAVEDIAISIDEPITYTEQLIVPGTAYELDPDIKVPAAEEALEIAASLQVQAGGESPVEIILNDEDVAVVGQEYNLYHYAVCHGNRPYTDYDIAVTLSYVAADGKTVYQAANNYAECFRFTPDTARDYTLTYRVRAKKPMSYADAADLARKSMTLHVIPNTAVSGKRILVIGDSFTDAGYWVAELQHNLSHGGIVSVGTVSDTVTIGGQSLTVLHEGRSGWATWDYAGTAPNMMGNFTSSRNVFRNADGKFDLGHYFDTYHGGETVDAICIFLGTNGLGADTSTENGMTELINRAREYDADVPILLHYTLQNVGQDYWGKFADQHTSTRDYRQHLCRKQYEIYRTKYATLPNVYVVPVYESLDYDLDFPHKEVAASARNTTTVSRVTDGHPSKEGYLKMADVYFAWLLYILTKD